MRGHEPLQSMRRRRLAPSMALVDLVPSYSRASADWPRWTTTPHLEVDDRETVRRLDLRCLHALPVVCCSGFDAERVDELHDACLAAGAERVFSSRYVTGPGEWGDESLRVLSIRASWSDVHGTHAEQAAEVAHG